MIRNTILTRINYYYPLGNTPAVSLTQDLPPEQNADILLLGCGDARNVLFTCFADAARKIDVTCCDIEPGIHARNILLYSLLIDDTSNLNFESIWNIYFHWMLDKDSAKLLETQAEKLLGLSRTVDEWNASLYGPSIRFCDSRSLSCTRSYWMGFQSRDLSSSEKKYRMNQLQENIRKAKANRKKMIKDNRFDITGVRSALPVGVLAVEDVMAVAKQWWDCGTTSSNSASLKPTELNPAFLYSPNQSVMLHYGLSPLLGIPLCTAYIPISKESAFRPERKSSSSVEYLVDCAKSHFSRWACAFRKAVANQSVIRIFCGDALAFGLTLRNCQPTMSAHSRSMNVFCNSWTNSRLELHHSDYGNNENTAPLNFDIIDTSNLVDYSGPLNVIGVGSSLLKYHASSSLYTEMLLKYESSGVNRLSAFFGVDVLSVSLLLGLVPPDLFTNATDTVDEDPSLEVFKGSSEKLVTQSRSRLRWKRLPGCQELSNFPYLHLEAKSLAKLLVKVHDAMFQHEDPAALFSTTITDVLKCSIPPYNRGSFAFFLNLLRVTVVSDWRDCVGYIYNNVFSVSSIFSVRNNFAQELGLNMHLYGVDNGIFEKPNPYVVRNAILARILPARTDMPEHVNDTVCVTVCVPREKLGFFTRQSLDQTGSPTVCVHIEGGDSGEIEWNNMFTSVQIAFGTWHKETEELNSYPYIDEDSSQLSGTSDMFVSVIVPTHMLLHSKVSVPWVKCGILSTAQTVQYFKDLGPDLCFFRSKITSKDVFVTQFMPGMSGLPNFAISNIRQVRSPSDITTVQLTDDGSKIVTLSRRLILQSDTDKAKLALKSSTVDIKFVSPLIATVNIAKSLQFKLEFPIPVSPTKYKVKIARKSSYIEVEAPPFDPLVEDAASFLFPTFITKSPCGTIPTPWTSTRIDLDAMPPMYLKGTDKVVSLLSTHISSMFSVREAGIRNLGSQVDTRTDIKESLLSLFMQYTGLQGKQSDFFGLHKKDGGNQTLIFPSSLRLDLVNHTLVLDSAVVPLTHAMFSDPMATLFFQELTSQGLVQIIVSDAEFRAWNTLMPALVERCRTWKHNPDCAYMQFGEVPLSKGVHKEGVAPICLCGVGKFPPGDYLKSSIKRIPKLSYMLNRYATRIAIAPIFVVPHLEDCYLSGLINDKVHLKKPSNEKCAKCGSDRRNPAKPGVQVLLTCSRCKKVRYCSTVCQKADWKKHKPVCSA